MPDNNENPAPVVNDEENDTPAVNGSNQSPKWTIMFFFASDNALSPLLISQVRAIKDAGFEQNTQILAYFDSNERGVPTRVYNMNRFRRLNSDGNSIGDGRDPFIHHIGEDDVFQKFNFSGKAAAVLKDMVDHPTAKSSTAARALQVFLDFCREEFKADRYMLILVGHGMIVGNDRFLPDESPDSAITLVQLGEIIRQGFTDLLTNNATLELLALHSCSMSGVEVAYQLKGTAKRMMATQGISFVGSWPYRQLMKKTFNAIDRGSVDVPDLCKSIFQLSNHNGSDFMSAGYSSDICLCDLSEGVLDQLAADIARLATILKEYLTGEYGKDFTPVTDSILLSHWKSQSYWQEEYTDLFDFCACLEKRCTDEGLTTLRKACQAIKEQISANIQSTHFGSKYQYSHGLSIFFPWCAPVEDETEHVIQNYEKYGFTIDFKESDQSWLSFLRVYWECTKRKSREEEDGIDTSKLKEFKDSGFVNPVGSLSGDPNKTSGATGPGDKTSGASGVGCSCPSIKNYPTEVFEVQGKPLTAKKLSISGQILDFLDVEINPEA
ncbi:MAG TPA: clostripain-related cysteine peptidase [Pyrinomonadaceae bacterium]